MGDGGFFERELRGGGEVVRCTRAGLRFVPGLFLVEKNFGLFPSGLESYSSPSP